METDDRGEGVCFHSAAAFKLHRSAPAGGLRGPKNLLQLHFPVLMKTAAFLFFSLFKTTERSAPR